MSRNVIQHSTWYGTRNANNPPLNHLPQTSRVRCTAFIMAVTSAAALQRKLKQLLVCMGCQADRALPLVTTMHYAQIPLYHGSAI